MQVKWGEVPVLHAGVCPEECSSKLTCSSGYSGHKPYLNIFRCLNLSDVRFVWPSRYFPRMRVRSLLNLCAKPCSSAPADQFP